MFKKNSIFTRVLIPLIIVLLLQTLLISLVLFVNGTIAAIDNSAIDSLRKNAENRGITLESTMINNWSNLDKLEADVISLIGGYLSDNRLTVEDLLGDYYHETGLLSDISSPMLSSFRRSSANGIFIYLVDPDTVSPGALSFNGLYYRDLDPMSTPADYSDILFLRGFVDIARKDKIQLDSLWSELFAFHPDDGEAWNSFYLPLSAALDFPGLSSADLSYWSIPHFLVPDSPMDTAECITYTRPVFYNGDLVAIIGSEIQTDLLRKYFPASDYDSSGMGGYLLLRFDNSAPYGDSLRCSASVISGSYLKRLFSPGQQLSLSKSRSDSTFSVDSAEEPVLLSLVPLRLYNSYAPFNSQTWALASAATENMLLDVSNKVRTGILFSCILSLSIGVIIIAVTVRVSTKPLLSLAKQIECSGANDTIISTKADTYETALLCSTINALRDRRKHIETMLREERERYLVALESAGDTFMEYDIASDVLRLYHFSPAHGAKELVTREKSNLISAIRNGEICHHDDIPNLIKLFSVQTDIPIEVRISCALLSHITDTEPDNGFIWMRVNASCITGDDGNPKKIIGTARQIMDIKLKEQALLESKRRDLTTGLFNRDYGLSLIVNRAHAAQADGTPFAVCVLRVDNFKKFEAFYGRVFSSVVLMTLCDVLRNIIHDDDIASRLANDVFILFLDGAGKIEVRNRIYQLFEQISLMYAGENEELSIVLSIGASLSVDAASASEVIDGAHLAERFATATGGGHLEYFDELPPEALLDNSPVSDTPVSVSVDISKSNIVGLSFDLFERTFDVHSVINILLTLIGRFFLIDEIIICSYDAAFSANQITYRWDSIHSARKTSVIEKVLHKDLAELERLLDENGVQLFGGGAINLLPEGVAKLLCARDDEVSSTLCIALYDNVVQTGRILFRSLDGSKLWTSSEISPLYEISRIISARISIERSNSASRAKSEFLSKISHEIRTPMNAIIGMTGIAKDSISSPERIADCLDKIDFSAKHLLALINDVLEVSRIESGRLELELAPFSIRDFVSALDTLMRPHIEGRDIVFKININCRHTRVIGDEYRLRQVLVNLLGNAAKFTDPGGFIALTVEELGAGGGEFGYFRFSVSDNGVGISKENQKIIFAAFSQVDSGDSRRGKSQGTGLGLTISGSIVGAMGSKIELESELGAGSDFFFVLKLYFAEEPPPPDRKRPETVDYTAYFSGKRLLLAEDNDINLEIATYILEAVGFIVVPAKNGLEALEKFSSSEANHFCAVLMDIQMPVMDGLDAAGEIRKLDRPDAALIPIIAMTANAFDEDMKKSIESGMDGHIAKPIDNDDLYKLLFDLIHI